MTKIRFILAMSFILFAVVAGKAKEPDFMYIREAKDAVRLFVEAKYDSLYAKFDENMAKQFTTETLEVIWNKLENNYGKFEMIKSAQLLPNDKMWMVDLTIGFINQDVSGKITYDSTNNIAGIFFTQANKKSDFYKIPNYADTSLFYEQNISFGDSQWELEGTLTIPKNVIGNAPLVILVQGFGSHDRDLTLGKNKIFKDIAWGLASKGIAVFRYDKRTFTYQNKVAKQIDLDFDDVIVDDVLAAINKLHASGLVNNKKIYVAGHSLGGYLLPRVIKNSDKLAGAIFLAPLGRNIAEVMLDQYKYFANMDGKIDDNEAKSIKAFTTQVNNSKIALQNDRILPKDLPFGLPGSFWKYLDNYKLEEFAKDVNIPTLFLQGKNDFQVTEKDWKIWESIFSNKKDCTMMKLDNLDHIFHNSLANPTPQDYLKYNHVDKTLVDAIFNWLNNK